jgi:hypothetical protein
MGARRRRSCSAVHCMVVQSVVSAGWAKQPQTQVNPSPQKYSSLPKFGNIVCVGHPSPQKGRSYVVTNAGWELRWTRAALKAGLLRAGRDEPREHGTNRIDGRRPDLAKPLAKQACPAKPLGEAGSACVRRNRVVLAVVATVKPLRRRQRVNRRGAVHFAGVTETKRNSSPGRARHRPSNHRAGKAWSRLPCVSPVHCVCNQFAWGFLWVPAGARSSLRPFFSRG